MSYKEQAVANKLLVAMPDNVGGFFEKSVILMLEHNKSGAMGLTLTHPANMTMQELLSNLDIDTTHAKVDLDKKIMLGGPVQPDRGFILHTGDSLWENTARLPNNLSVTVSLDLLRAAAAEGLNEDFEIFLGYAGWGAGQLEQELRNNHWLFAESDPELIFSLPPEARWQAAFTQLGINTQRLSRTMGHA
jgi:putative transcriptional regulator